MKVKTNVKAETVQWLAVLRDTAVVYGLTFLGGVILSIKAATTDQKVTVVEMAVLNLIFGTIGFTISGYRAAHHRWRHLSMVAVAVWISSLPNIRFGFTLGQWTISIFPTFAMMGIGGWLSTCLKSRIFHRPNAKRCPFCAEEILAEARVCKHCRRDIVDTPVDLSPAQDLFQSSQA